MTDKTGLFVWAVVAALAGAASLALLSGRAFAAEPAQVWVPEHALSDGTVIPGHWRPAKKPGFLWVAGHVDESGNWVPGYWEPVGPPPRGKIWKRGYWLDGRWRPGQWAPVHPGRSWVPGHYGRGGRRVPGHWR